MSRKLENLRKEAKRWLKQLRAGDSAARTRLEAAWPAAPAAPVLRDIQYALAREHGVESWRALTGPLRVDPHHQQAAEDLVKAFDGDAAALDRVNRYYNRLFTFEDVKAQIWRRVYAFRQRSGRGEKNYLALAEAQLIIAQDAGFPNWDALLRGEGRTGPYFIDGKEERIAPHRLLSGHEWDALLAAARERRITAIDANGMMTDSVLARVAELDHITALNLGGSRELTDDGLLLLARMPQLQRLNLSEYPGGKLTDRGLAVLRYLPNLRNFEMTWQAGITDGGVANLRFCDQLESVDLMGSPTGDGAIAALAGKPNLRRFHTGRLVTDAGLPLLRDLPALADLLIDGPFTDTGVAGLAGTPNITALDLFWHVTAITSAAIAHLAQLPNLEVLGCDGKLSDDDAMRHIASMPRLRKLRAQESVATDAGFEALSASQTLEGIWGRVCPNFGSRGFRALSRMPALHSLGIGCANVDDEALATLPDFPSLRELTPVGFQDAGFRHIGRCPSLERLTCMYCRETTDAATEHIAGLALKYYYAGLTQITDRSLEILGAMNSLEHIDFYECLHVTDAGLPHLAKLPNLREIHLDSLPGVTLVGTKVFPAGVRVYYST